jgi:hypothetical protein
MRIHIGVFAHNEQQAITALLEDLAAQDLFERPDLHVRVFVLANGCTDATVRMASEAVARMPPHVARAVSVLDLPFKGKSRTWNHFVHALSAGHADCIYFVDADIRIPQRGNLGMMLQQLTATGSVVVNSRPRKDIEVAPAALSLMERVIVLSSGVSSDYRHSISGQLYLARAHAIEGIHMPVGLPVEDGFLRAMVVTRLLTEAEDLQRIHGEPGIWHVYASLRTARALVRHQTRLVIGGAINNVVYGELCAQAVEFGQRSALLRSVCEDERWLARVLRGTLPRWPSGFVPVHFLVKRLYALRSARQLGPVRTFLLLTAGLAFDTVVYLNAQFQMARGRGAGYW